MGHRRAIVTQPNFPWIPGYMGHFPQDGKNEQNVSFFSFFWSFTVTKRFDFLKFSQLFWRDYVRCSLKILLFTLQKIFGVPCSTPDFALLSHFWVKIRAVVRQNLPRWTGFDLLRVFWVKFWWFSFFFKSSVALLEAELTVLKDWEEMGNIWEI